MIRVRMVSRKSAWKHLGSKECQKERNAGNFWTWILGVNFLGAWSPGVVRLKNSLEKAAEKFTGNLPKIRRTNVKNLTPNPLCRTSGSTDSRRWKKVSICVWDLECTPSWGGGGVTNGVVTNGALKGKSAFSVFCALFQRARAAPQKSRKRKKKALICFSPHILNPHLRHSNKGSWNNTPSKKGS